jgi:hypothetical protein
MNNTAENREIIIENLLRSYSAHELAQIIVENMTQAEFVEHVTALTDSEG